MAEIKLQAIRKSYGRTEVIHGIDAEIKDGEFIVIVGPSGCGKSTLLRMVAGLETITSGDIRIGFPNEGKLGSVVSGALEGSNVDIAEELTDMIEAQRNYTANSKVFQTGSDLLDILVNLKR